MAWLDTAKKQLNPAHANAFEMLETFASAASKREAEVLSGNDGASEAASEAGTSASAIDKNAVAAKALKRLAASGDLLQRLEALVAADGADTAAAATAPGASGGEEPISKRAKLVSFLEDPEVAAQLAADMSDL